MKKYIALFLAVLAVMTVFTACNGGEDDVPTRVVGSDIVTNDANLNNPDLNINNSWSDNFYAMYTYYCPAQGYNSATVISERKAANSFIISNPVDGSFKYYLNNDSGMDEYAVNPSKNIFKHNIYSGQYVGKNINSMFKNISMVTENFTNGPDVVYTGTETVADRNCWMYLQRTYTPAGEVDKVAYLWIDAVYGFCAKCITYSDGDVVLSWELQEFSIGNVQDADIKPDLTAYTFTQN